MDLSEFIKGNIIIIRVFNEIQNESKQNELYIVHLKMIFFSMIFTQLSVSFHYYSFTFSISLSPCLFDCIFTIDIVFRLS